MTKRIAIIGAGIAGLSTAWYLHKQGCAITVIDEQHQVAQGCSHANAAQMAVCNALSWHRAGYLVKGLASLLSAQSAVHLGSLWDVAKLQWLMRFVHLTLTGKRDDISQRLIQLSLRNQLLLDELLAELNVEFHYNQAGVVIIYKQGKALHKAYRELSQWHSEGLQVEKLSLAELADLEPNANWQDVVGGVVTKADRCGDIFLFCQQLGAILVDQGQRIEPGIRVTGLLSRDRHWQLQTSDATSSIAEQCFDQVVVAAGAHTPELIDAYKKTHIYPVSGYSITLDMSDLPESKRASLAMLDDHSKVATSCLGNQYRLAGFAEWRGLDTSIKSDRINQLLAWFKHRYPDLKIHKPYSEWACMRPMRPDMLPITEQIAPNLYVNSGGGHLGWTTALSCAEHLAKQILAA